MRYAFALLMPNRTIPWGGVDTQNVSGGGTPEQVRDDVRRRLKDFMPGGGFVFNTVHNIQGNVLPESIMAMWETLQEYGVYSGRTVRMRFRPPLTRTSRK